MKAELAVAQQPSEAAFVDTRNHPGLTTAG